MSELIMVLFLGLLLIATHVIVWRWGYVSASDAWASIANTGRFLVWRESKFRVQYYDIDHEIDKILKDVLEDSVKSDNDPSA